METCNRAGVDQAQRRVRSYIQHGEARRGAIREGTQGPGASFQRVSPPLCRGGCRAERPQMYCRNQSSRTSARVYWLYSVMPDLANHFGGASHLGTRGKSTGESRASTFIVRGEGRAE